MDRTAATADGDSRGHCKEVDGGEDGLQPAAVEKSLVPDLTGYRPRRRTNAYVKSNTIHIKPEMKDGSKPQNQHQSPTHHRFIQPCRKKAKELNRGQVALPGTKPKDLFVYYLRNHKG